MITKRFIDKTIRVFNELGLNDLLNNEISYQDIKNRILTNLFSYEENPLFEENDFSENIFWITRKLKKINKLILSNQLADNVIDFYKNRRYKVNHKPNHNVFVLSNLFNMDYVLYNVSKNIINEIGISDQLIKIGKKENSGYSIIKDAVSNVNFIYDSSYINSLSDKDAVDVENAVGAFVYNSIPGYGKSIGTIECYSNKLYNELSAINDKNNVSGVSILSAIILVITKNSKSFNIF